MEALTVKVDHCIRHLLRNRFQAKGGRDIRPGRSWRNAPGWGLAAVGVTAPNKLVYGRRAGRNHDAACASECEAPGGGSYLYGGAKTNSLTGAPPPWRSAGDINCRTEPQIWRQSPAACPLGLRRV